MNQDHEKREAGRAKRLANLRPPWSSENQPPGHMKSRKGIPNRQTILNHWMKAFEEQEAAKAKAKAAKHRDAERKRRAAKKRAKELAASVPKETESAHARLDYAVVVQQFYSFSWMLIVLRS